MPRYIRYYKKPCSLTPLQNQLNLILGYLAAVSKSFTDTRAAVLLGRGLMHNVVSFSRVLKYICKEGQGQVHPAGDLHGGRGQGS